MALHISRVCASHLQLLHLSQVAKSPFAHVPLSPSDPPHRALCPSHGVRLVLRILLEPWGRTHAGNCCPLRCFVAGTLPASGGEGVPQADCSS